MSKYMSVNVDTFLAETAHLTTAQAGAFFMLMTYAWKSQGCKIPDNDTILSNYARMDIRAWRAQKPIIMSLWHKDEDEKWSLPAVTISRKHAEGRSYMSAKAGAASALKRLDTGSKSVQRPLDGISTKVIVSKKVSKKDNAEPPEGDPAFLIYEGKVIRIIEPDWIKLRKKLGLEDAQLAALMDDRDKFLNSLSENDRRRTAWWMPTMRWLDSELENIKHSNGAGSL